MPPFIASDAADGVAAPGQFLRVPASVAVVSADQSADLVFERDAELVGGDLTVVAGDFGVVGGRDNLRQALRHRLGTEAGELMFHPSYGSRIRSLIGAINGPTAGLLAAAYARSAVLEDPRISRVNTAKAQVVGDSITVTAEAVPIVGKAVDVSATA